MTHTTFATTTYGLRRDAPAMRLFEKAKRLGIWNPSDIDLSRDRADPAAAADIDRGPVGHAAARLAHAAGIAHRGRVADAGGHAPI